MAIGWWLVAGEWHDFTPRFSIALHERNNPKSAPSQTINPHLLDTIDPW
ncbi:MULTISPECIES: hypothetical protein [unclassified Chamaesiphon]|nr:MULTISPECIES: hypothetical protein [unclassified Chamaesiphon]